MRPLSSLLSPSTLSRLQFEEVLYYHSLGSDSCVLPGAGHDLLLSPDESAAATLEAGVLRFAAKWF